MNAAVSTFRGFHGIGEVIERMEPLGNWLQAFKPETKVLTLRRRDLDLLQRWPKAAALYHVYTVDGVTHWRGFVLRADASPPRYVP